MKRTLLVVWLVPVLLVLATGAEGNADIESRARAIEGKLMAPCCMANTVAEHYSPIAEEMRLEIREKLRQGQTSEQILAFYAEKHGDLVLAMPAAEGFNLVAWLVPMFFLIVGPAVVYLVLRSWRAQHKTVPVKSEPAAAIDPKYAERLRQSLAKLE